MKKLFIITGANKGLGKAFYDILIRQENNSVIVSISRRLSEDQQQLIDNGSNRFAFISLDLSQIKDASGLRTLENYKEAADKIIFINNAGVIEPIGAVGQFNDEELGNSINVNVLSPALIINYILKVFTGKRIDIINISSGAAKKIVEGWAVYCSGKAFMDMLMKALDVQMKDNFAINVYNIDPGIIDTEMQQAIRNTHVEAFSRHSEFVAYKNEGKLQKAESVALNILKETNLLL